MLGTFDDLVLYEVVEDVVTGKIEAVPKERTRHETTLPLTMTLVGAYHEIGRAGTNVDASHCE